MQSKTIAAVVMSFGLVSAMQAMQSPFLSMPLHGSFVDQVYRDYPRTAAAITVLGGAGAGAYIGHDLATRINAVPEKARIFAAAGLGTLSAICLISPFMSRHIYWEKIALGLGGSAALGVGTTSLLTNENTQALVNGALGAVSPGSYALLGGSAGALLTLYASGIYLNRHAEIHNLRVRNNNNNPAVITEYADFMFPKQENGSVISSWGTGTWFGQKMDDNSRQAHAARIVDHYGSQPLADSARTMLYGSGITLAFCLGGATVWEKSYN